MRQLLAEENRLEKVLRKRERRTMTPRCGERLAGVLVPLLADADGFDLLIERRSRNLSHHAGQYGFPGGAADPEDRTIVDTALREVREEIGLDPEHVQILGLLSDIRTPTGYVITPVVGAVDGPVTLVPSPSEVAFLIRVPVSFVLSPGVFTEVTQRSNGLLIRTKALVWNEHVIWGATARILQALARIMRP